MRTRPPSSPPSAGITRRGLLIGGGAGVGLVLAWAVWPRKYLPNLTADPGETIFGAWIKIGTDGHVTVAVPQAEHGQGVYTALPQIVADELGADWRTIAVEPAPLNPLYANPLGTTDLLETTPGTLAARWQGRAMLTAGSSSVRTFENDLQQAGAAARVLLCKVAAARWQVDWQTCDTSAGFVTHGKDRLRFADLAAEAARGTLPEALPMRINQDDSRLSGQSLPRLDAPAKLDGSANFAGDVRLPDMVFASIRQGPAGDSKLLRVDRAAADRIPGVLQVVTNDRWVAAIGNSWWAANRALDALAPRFGTRGPIVTSALIDAALQTALAAPGKRVAAFGDVDAAFKDARLVTADYHAGLSAHAALETMTATARFDGGRLELWLPTLAPGLARDAAAAAAGIAADRVVVHPMLIGGSFGAKLDHTCAEQAAVLAVTLKRPVQLTWSRVEDLLHDRFRPPASARMAARLGPNGQILGWRARIAAPATGQEIAARLFAHDTGVRTTLALTPAGDPYAVAGALPPYRIAACAIDHHPADIGVPTGHWRSGAHSYTAFFTECFLDELAHLAGIEALSFRIGLLGGNPRLARCLSTAASLGGWEGGIAGSGQGIACHSFRGSHIAVLVEAHVGEGSAVSVDRIVAAVDCGRQINPDLVRQQIEGGLLFGMAAATGGSTGFAQGLPLARSLGDLDLPRLADTPDITVELISSEADPGGVSELAVPPVAPAIANALQAATGYRLRRLPLVPGSK
ncbi:xanthine dehydrogenase family protein molybdopterin-binding subunit [Sphingomonas sp. PAMC 26617]|uniref:xanthine dehydrogenase family protein molybdopterin-binding subunit n=1 Tax=Sphingomonas sp. PAMC 26617 TaxID=1112216 RepID=UPI0002E361CC|nr:molybdopterin cofactor-binding domain-containing protein [Sphingomonas sp. PAMC 26617]